MAAVNNPYKIVDAVEKNYTLNPKGTSRVSYDLRFANGRTLEVYPYKDKTVLRMAAEGMDTVAFTYQPILQKGQVFSQNNKLEPLDFNFKKNIETGQFVGSLVLSNEREGTAGFSIKGDKLAVRSTKLKTDSAQNKRLSVNEGRYRMRRRLTKTAAISGAMATLTGMAFTVLAAMGVGNPPPIMAVLSVGVFATGAAVAVTGYMAYEKLKQRHNRVRSVIRSKIRSIAKIKTWYKSPENVNSLNTVHDIIHGLDAKSFKSVQMDQQTQRAIGQAVETVLAFKPLFPRKEIAELRRIGASLDQSQPTDQHGSEPRTSIHKGLKGKLLQWVNPAVKQPVAQGSADVNAVGMVLSR